MDRDWARTERLLTLPPGQGGLALGVAGVLASAGPLPLTQAEEDAAHQRYMASNHRGAAQKLGYGSSRCAVGQRPGVNVITDRG